MSDIPNHDAIVGDGAGATDRDSYRWDGAEPDFWGRRAWTRACGVCALGCGDPQKLGEETLEALREEIRRGQIDFYCSHRRTKAGMHRICAGAAALEMVAKGEREC